MRLKTTFSAWVALFCFVSATYATNQIDIRFFPRALDIDNNAVYVDIEVRTTMNARVILAGQNYRIYYDSEVLKLDEGRSVSQLPEAKYNDLIFLEKFENVRASDVGALAFDKNLGFANFSIELKDDINGGVVLTKKDGWTTMATLKFKLIKNDKDYSVVWGRESRSKEYATAFVEVAEWIEPLKTKHLDIVEYFDLNVSPDLYKGDPNPGSLVIGPNPASDFLRISLPKDLPETGEMLIKDIAGRLAKKIQVQQGSRVIRLDLSDLTPATYIVELQTPIEGRQFAEQIIITE